MNDDIKEQISYCKLWLGVMVVLITTLAGWVFQNYTTAPRWQIFGAAFLVTVFIIRGLDLHFLIVQLIGELRRNR